MKNRVIASLMALFMATSLLAGCGATKETEEIVETQEVKLEDILEEDEAEEVTEAGDDYNFEIILKSYQVSYWQAAVTGVEQRSKELGVTANVNGPNTESDSEDQVKMLEAAIERHPDGIGIAACDPSTVMEALQKAKEAGIPVVCFDSGVPDAPAGAVYSTIATDNYGAGATAAENLYSAVCDEIGGESAVRVGVINQDAVSDSIISRGLGFIDRFAELAADDGYSVALTGNDTYVSGARVESAEEYEADIIIEASVSAETNAEACAAEAKKIMSKEETIAVFGTNQVASEGIIAANEKLERLGLNPEENIVAAGFDAGAIIKKAIQSELMLGAVTQSPLAMGQITIEVLTKIANGESVSDVATEGYWYDLDNMDSEEIAPNLYN